MTQIYGLKTRQNYSVSNKLRSPKVQVTRFEHKNVERKYKNVEVHQHVAKCFKCKRHLATFRATKLQRGLNELSLFPELHLSSLSISLSCYAQPRNKLVHSPLNS
jgi:hypothetical protein